MSTDAVRPVQPDDDQYSLRVVDTGGSAKDPILDLDPFTSVAPIDHSLTDSLQYVRDNPNKKYILVMILRNNTPPEIEQIIRNNLRYFTNLSMVHLFFTNGSRFHNAWRSRHAPLIHSCRSITANISRDLRTICSAFCDLNIEFCDDRLQDCQQQQERSIGNIFHHQKITYINLKQHYTDRQRRECTQISGAVSVPNSN
ncbi:unnamed protein product [Adineta steineri]|uniref:Uncharacterized protein n=1 Tax=Adineta steineri TaxID=433720 RepID=A0A816AE67_9BILA|nr:unnamed protein product [Adineta steineri]CAF1596524.1 unnamed protein product [Adineta steineri]